MFVGSGECLDWKFRQWGLFTTRIAHSQKTLEKMGINILGDVENIQWKSISIDLQKFSIEMISLLELFFLTLMLHLASPRDPFITLVSYENSQRMSAEIGDSQYQLLPFRLSGKSQHFIQTPKVNQFLNVEVVVHWITNDSMLQFPSFDLTQKVRLVIEEQNMGGVVPKQSILTKQFLTQTGFKLQLQGGHRYRWKIESSGVTSKLVQIAMVNKPKNMTNPGIVVKEMHQEEVKVLREMSKTLEKAKQVRAYRQSKAKESKVADMWAWMSGMEMVSLLGFLLVQLALFEKFTLPASIV